jgi:hypothetical protein
MPMHKWIASAAGGTSQRLNSGVAMIRSFDRRGAGSALTVVVTGRVLYSGKCRMAEWQDLDPQPIQQSCDSAILRFCNSAIRQFGNSAIRQFCR